MKNEILNTGSGDSFFSVAQKAKEISVEHKVNVEFDFNGIKCIVSGNTNTDLLYRDYANAWTMEWKEVGPDCPIDYPLEIKAELTKRKDDDIAKEEIRRNEVEIKDKEERRLFAEKTRGIEIELKNIEGWNKSKSINTDGYGSCVLEYAEGWAKLMQSEISKGKELKDIAQPTSFELGFLGITGYMYGAAVSILSQCWKYGEELRKWHNKEYNHEGDGVVNPAIMTLSV